MVGLLKSVYLCSIFISLTTEPHKLYGFNALVDQISWTTGVDDGFNKPGMVKLTPT